MEFLPIYDFNETETPDAVRRVIGRREPFDAEALVVLVPSGVF
jgi:hypothetical protein